ncbi:MAG: hypothetical protein K6F26_09260 [Lachnospiraceae bacterium]|nr:hypothetical protein [Lachnospiraceae bacterium]
MDCTTCQECTKQYIEGQLPQNRILEYCAHLEECSACREDLYINYAIVTALKQLNDGEELSADYVKEVDTGLAQAKARIHRGARLRVYRRLFIALEILGIAGAMALFPQREKGYAYLPEEEESRIVIEAYGVPTYMDPVIQGIYRYNDDVIACIRKAENQKER